MKLQHAMPASRVALQYSPYGRALHRVHELGLMLSEFGGLAMLWLTGLTTRKPRIRRWHWLS
jgi:hypothetical protein